MEKKDIMVFVGGQAVALLQVHPVLILPYARYDPRKVMRGCFRRDLLQNRHPHLFFSSLPRVPLKTCKLLIS